jgi:predicted phosphodiesterase
MRSLDEDIREAQKELTGKDPDVEALAELAEQLYSRGIDVRVENGRLLPVDIPADRGREQHIDLGSDHLRIGIVSDTHGGSKFEQLSALRRFYAYADEREVDFFIHAGDFVQGSHKMHRGAEHELHVFGADAQTAYVARTYPVSQRRVPTYAISGNHDDSFLKDGGVNVVRNLAAQREDIVYVGQDAAYLTIGNLRAYIVHPDGGGAYAKSYKPQKIAESLPADKNLALVLIGHYHVWGSFKHQRAYAFMLPCFQSQYSWLARKGLHPDIGGVIVDLWLDDAGWPRRVAHEFVDFKPAENDWDHEVSRDVQLAWSSKGLAL